MDQEEMTRVSIPGEFRATSNHQQSQSTGLVDSQDPIMISPTTTEEKQWKQ